MTARFQAEPELLAASTLPAGRGVTPDVATPALLPVTPPATERDLLLARQVQESLLPKTYPALPGFTIAGHCRTAGQVGGDFFDVFSGPNGAVVFVVADVMGKGMAAALFAAILRSVTRLVAESTTAAGAMLSRVNALMGDELSAVDMFITAQVMIIHPGDGHLSIANAGHCPMLFRNSSWQVVKVCPPGLPLGVSRDAEYTDLNIPIGDLSCALLYSDGVTDAQSPNGDFLGQDGLEAWFKSAGSGHDAAGLRQSLAAQLTRFSTAGAPRDDQTFLLVAAEPGSRREDSLL